MIIGAYSQPKTTTFDDDPQSNKYKLSNEYHGAVYSLLLDENNQSFLQEIILPNSFKLTGYSTTIFNSKIALGATTEQQPYIKPGKVLLVDPATLKVDSVIEPPSQEQKFADFGFVIDGNEDFLLVSSRGLTKKGGALLIDKIGEFEEISSVEDSISPLLKAGYSVSLTNKLIAVGNSYGEEIENTLLLKRSKKGWSLVDTIRFGGSLDANESYVLISSGKSYGMPTGIFNRRVHTLVEIDDDKPKIKSKIYWKLNSDFKYEAKGLIHNDQLLLSHKGKVVLLSKIFLPRNYVINRLFCKGNQKYDNYWTR